jgi:hypothetical protein
MTGATFVPRGQTYEEMVADASCQPVWLWPGFLAARNVTLLTSQWKMGKTSLLATLLARMKTGGDLAGRPVSLGRAAVLTEENAAHWARRGQQLDLNAHTWFCQPYRGKPTLPQWLALLEHLAESHARRPFDLVVLDTLGTMLPGRDENNAGLMLEALAPLQALTSAGLAVLLLHHPKKGETLPGQSSRGSGVVPSFADILIEMHWYRRGLDEDRRRRLLAWSRFPQTPRQLVIERSADGADYAALGDFEGEAFFANWEALRGVLSNARRPQAQKELLADWPANEKPPSELTLWRWLERAAAEGLVLRRGSGRRSDPYRYCLPGQEAEWRANEGKLPDLPPLSPLGGW